MNEDYQVSKDQKEYSSMLGSVRSLCIQAVLSALGKGPPSLSVTGKDIGDGWSKQTVHSKIPDGP